MFEVGGWKLEVGCWIPVAASAEREAGCWMLVTARAEPEAGLWRLVIRHC